MRIIIFGSSGFIGSALVKKFASENSNIVDGCDMKVGDSNSYLNQFYPATDKQELYNSIFQNSYDLCINCAGSASVSFSFENPLFDYELNTLLVFRILDAIKVWNPDCRFLNFSSAAVYGNPTILPIKESSAVNPISPYGNHKMMSEVICKQFKEFWNIETLSLRVFSAYGPGLRKQLMWDIFKKIKKGGMVSLYGTGEESRDFIYIEDLVNAVYLITQETIWPDKVNIANGKEEKIKSVVEAYKTCYPDEFEFKFTGEVKEGDPTKWVADLSYLNSLNYAPKYSINQGIQEYVSWLMNSN